MITRVWRGWTTVDNAPTYEQLLISTIFPAIAARRIPGYHGIRLDRRLIGDEIEFLTTMEFASMHAVVAFAGSAYATAVVPPVARAVLARYDAEAAHYERVEGPACQ